MTDQLASWPRTLPALPAGAVVPAIVADCGEQVAWRYLDFFAANIRNPNTRAAYARACSGFFAWCETLALALPGIQPVHVAAWVEQLRRDGRSAPTLKQNLAAVRMLFEWLVVGQVVPHNPASAVRGPKHSMVTGKTHMPSREEAKALIASIDTGQLIGLRDRALIGTLLFTFLVTHEPQPISGTGKAWARSARRPSTGAGSSRPGRIGG
jgi:site-specific recombinase XerC